MRLELVEQARHGDRDAFDVLMHEVIDRLYSIALVAQDTDIAEDAVQEALVRCWRDLPTLRDPSRFEPWLRRLLLNSVERLRGRANPVQIRLCANHALRPAKTASLESLLGG